MNEYFEPQNESLPNSEEGQRLFDGRKTGMSLNNAQTYATNLFQDRTHQAIDATERHAQAAGAPSAQKIDEIVRFESGLSTAQVEDNDAGPLNRNGASGGPSALAAQNYYLGMNDVIGNDPDGEQFNPNAFSPLLLMAEDGRPLPPGAATKSTKRKRRSPPAKISSTRRR